MSRVCPAKRFGKSKKDCSCEIESRQPYETLRNRKISTNIALSQVFFPLPSSLGPLFHLITQRRKKTKRLIAVNPPLPLPPKRCAMEHHVYTDPDSASQTPRVQSASVPRSQLAVESILLAHLRASTREP